MSVVCKYEIADDVISSAQWHWSLRRSPLLPRVVGVEALRPRISPLLALDLFMRHGRGFGEARVKDYTNGETTQVALLRAHDAFTYLTGAIVSF